MRLNSQQFMLGLVTALVLAACGGGGSGGGSTASGGTPSPTIAQAGSTSSGTLTAFGSVFVNGHEFDTTGAQVFDDDSGGTATGSLDNGVASATSNGLAVGMTVDVKAAGDSNSSKPHAGEIHIHPVARGYIDYSDPTGGTLQVMGQSIAVSATTVFRDDRACVSASSAPCTAITSQSGILAAYQSCAAAGSGFQNQGGGSFVPGLYAQVFGLISTSSAGSSIQATLVRILDPGSNPVFKAEGAITAVGSGTPPSSFALNGLTLDTSTACTSASSCAYAAGTVVTARGHTAPTISCVAGGISVSFTPSALQPRRGATLTAGATVELEGIAGSVVSSTTPATFLLDGVTIDVGSGLTLPASGDHVEVLGTVNSDLSVTATAIQTEESEAQQRQPFLIQDTLANGAVSGSGSSYQLSILGTQVLLDQHTRFFDATASGGSSASNPFNISTVSSYLGALGTPTVVVVGYQDSSVSPAVLHALLVKVVTASSNVRVGGVVTTAPGSGTSLIIDGTGSSAGFTVTVSPSTTVNGSGTTASIQSGDFLLVTSGSETVSNNAVTGVTATALKDFHQRPFEGD